jgi:hypothetical protein
MSGPFKTALTHESATEETSETTAEERDQREFSVAGGRRLTLREAGADQLVEIRSESGMLELRIKLTPEGPVLQMESVRLELKASEAVQIESPHVAIRASEKLELSGGQVVVAGEESIDVEAAGDVRVVGKMIHLN